MEIRNFQQEIHELANKYALTIKEERLKENSVEELFREYRKTISDIIRDFPKCVQRIQKNNFRYHPRLPEM